MIKLVSIPGIFSKIIKKLRYNFSKIFLRLVQNCPNIFPKFPRGYPKFFQEKKFGFSQIFPQIYIHWLVFIKKFLKILYGNGDDY